MIARSSKARIAAALSLAAIPIAVACGSTQTPPAPIVAASTSNEPAASSAPPVDSSSAPPPADPNKAAAWNEPAVVAALTKDCNWHPSGYSAGTLSETPRALSCDIPWSQSCNYDPCPEDDCQTACAKTCDSCDATCSGACDTCKKSCTGADAEQCMAACATSCGACKQTCRTTRDTCATSECQKKADACWKDAEAKWKKNKCSCDKIAKCLTGCGADTYMQSPATADAKAKKCADSCTKKMPGCDFFLCMTFMSVGEPFSQPQKTQ